jgi:hypothetical protein
MASMPNVLPTLLITVEDDVSIESVLDEIVRRNGSGVVNRMSQTIFATKITLEDAKSIPGVSSARELTI